MGAVKLAVLTTAPAAMPRADKMVGMVGRSRESLDAYHSRVACSFPEACGRPFPGLERCLGSVDARAADHHGGEEGLVACGYTTGRVLRNVTREPLLGYREDARAGGANGFGGGGRATSLRQGLRVQLQRARECAGRRRDCRRLCHRRRRDWRATDSSADTTSM